MRAANKDRTPYSIAARKLLRDTLLDAACHELEQRRWVDITMNEIAVAAGVSRQTLYKEFGSREEFAQLLVLREAQRFLDAVQRAVTSNISTPSKALAAAFDVFLTAASENPLVAAIVKGDGAEELLRLFTVQGQPLVEGAATRLTELMLATWPLMKRPDAELLSETLVRLAISYAALPTGSSSMTAKSISTLLGPYVDKLLQPGRS